MHRGLVVQIPEIEVSFGGADLESVKRSSTGPWFRVTDQRGNRHFLVTGYQWCLLGKPPGPFAVTGFEPGYRH